MKIFLAGFFLLLMLAVGAGALFHPSDPVHAPAVLMFVCLPSFLGSWYALRRNVGGGIGQTEAERRTLGCLISLVLMASLLGSIVAFFWMIGASASS